MEQVILFKNNNGGVSVCYPSSEALQSHAIEEIAEKDVPAGKPYKIVSVDEIPSDRTFRDAWEADEADLTDGVGGEHDMFITDPQHPDYAKPVEGEVAE